MIKTFTGKITPEGNDMFRKLPGYIGALFGPKDHFFRFGIADSDDDDGGDRVVWVKEEGAPHTYGEGEHTVVLFEDLEKTKIGEWKVVKKYFDYVIECNTKNEKINSIKWKEKFDQLAVDFQQALKVKKKPTGGQVGIFSYLAGKKLSKSESSSSEEESDSDSEDADNEESLSEGSNESDEEDHHPSQQAVSLEGVGIIDSSLRKASKKMEVKQSSDCEGDSDGTDDVNSIENDVKSMRISTVADQVSNGFLYIMEDQPNRFKVSTSRDPVKRHLIYLASNVDIKLRAKYPVKNMQSAKKKCHSNLKKYLIPGHQEWFTGLDFRLIKMIVETAIR